MTQLKGAIIRSQQHVEGDSAVQITERDGEGLAIGQLQWSMLLPTDGRTDTCCCCYW